MLKYLGQVLDDGLAYKMGDCAIILSGPKERAQNGWHFSISCESRNPTWEEQRDARYALVPDGIVMVSVLPPKREYVNIQPFCFHWWEANAKFFEVNPTR